MTKYDEASKYSSNTSEKLDLSLHDPEMIFEIDRKILNTFSYWLNLNIQTHLLRLQLNPKSHTEDTVHRFKLLSYIGLWINPTMSHMAKKKLWQYKTVSGKWTLFSHQNQKNTEKRKE